MNWMLCLEAHSGTGGCLDHPLKMRNAARGTGDGWGLLRGLQAGAGAPSLRYAMAGRFWRRSSSPGRPSPRNNCCGSFWQAVANVACKWCRSVNAQSRWNLLFSRRASFVSTSCTILARRWWPWATFSLPSAVHFYEMTMLWCHPGLPRRRRWCSHRFGRNSSRAFEGWVLLQTFSVPANPSAPPWPLFAGCLMCSAGSEVHIPGGDRADVRSLEFTSPPPCLCLFPLSSLNKCWRQLRSWLTWISWSPGR